MQDKERTLNYFSMGDNIIFTMDEVFRNAAYSTRVSVTKEQAKDLFMFLQRTLQEHVPKPRSTEYKFVECPDILFACRKCAFVPDTDECNHHPCASDERIDKKEGYWEEETQYRFMPDPTSSNKACEYCVFNSLSAQCYAHQCSGDERMDKLDGYWEKA